MPFVTFLNGNVLMVTRGETTCRRIPDRLSIKEALDLDLDVLAVNLPWRPKNIDGIPIAAFEIVSKEFPDGVNVSVDSVTNRIAVQTALGWEVARLGNWLVRARTDTSVEDKTRLGIPAVGHILMLTAEEAQRRLT